MTLTFGSLNLVRIRIEAPELRSPALWMKLDKKYSSSPAVAEVGLQLYKSTWISPCWSTTASSTSEATQWLPRSTEWLRATCTETATSVRLPNNLILRTLAHVLFTWQTMPSRWIQRTTANLKVEISCQSMTSKGIWTQATAAKMSASCEICFLKWRDS